MFFSDSRMERVIDQQIAVLSSVMMALLESAVVKKELKGKCLDLLVCLRSNPYIRL